MPLIDDFAGIRRAQQALRGEKNAETLEMYWGVPEKVLCTEFEERYTNDGGTEWQASKGYYARIGPDGRPQRVSLPYELGLYRFIQTAI